jgi:hypothetical protein
MKAMSPYGSLCSTHVITLESLRLRSHCINPSYSLQKAPTFTVLVHPPFYQPLSHQRIPTLDQSTPAI